MSSCTFRPKIKGANSEYYSELQSLFSRRDAAFIYNHTAQFSRDEARNQKYIEDFKSRHPQVEYNEQGEPTLESILKEFHSFPEFTKLSGKERVSHIINDLNLQRPVEFEEAIQQVRSISTNLAIKDDWIASIQPVTDNAQSKFIVDIVPRTEENSLKLQNTFENFTAYQRLVQLSADLGLGTQRVRMASNIYGSFNDGIPKSTYKGIYQLIKINSTASMDIQTITAAEELSHAIVLCWNTPENSQALESLLNIAKGKKVELIRAGIITAEQWNKYEETNKLEDELAAKVLARVLYENGGRLDFSNPQTVEQRQIKRGFLKGKGILDKVTRWIATKVQKFTRTSTSEEALEILTSGKNNFSLLQSADLADLVQAAQSILYEVSHKKLDMEVILKNKRTFHNEVVTKKLVIDDLNSAFLQTMKDLSAAGLAAASTVHSVRQDLENATFKYSTDVQSINNFTKGAALSSYLSSYIEGLSNLFTDANFLTDQLDSKFTEATKILSNLTEDQDISPYVLLGALHLYSLPEHYAIMHKCLTLVQLLNNLKANLTSLRGTENQLTADFILQKIRENKIFEKLSNFVTQHEKGTFALSMISANDGESYIMRWGRMQETTSHNIKKLEETDIRQLSITGLIEALSESLGYYDFNSTTKGLFSSGMNSVDPITQLLDAAVKQRQQKSNLENMRSARKCLQLAEQLRTLNNGSSYAQFMCETMIENAYEVVIDDNNHVVVKRSAKPKKRIKTGNVLQKVNWGLWEDLQSQVYQKARAKFLEQNKGIIIDDTDLLSMRKWEEFYQPIYDEFHNKFSISYSEAKAHEAYKESVYFVKALSKINAKTDLVADNQLLFSKSLYFPNPDALNGALTNSEFNKLNSNQKNFIIDYIGTKMQYDHKVESYKRNQTVRHRLPQFKGSFLDKVSHTDGTVKRLVTDRFISQFLLTSDDQEFGAIDAYTKAEDSLVYGVELLPSETSRRLPIFGIQKLRDTELLSTDVCRSLEAYACMANNVEAMLDISHFSIIGEDVLAKRKVASNNIKKSGINSDDTSYIYERYCRYVDMQVFGRYHSISAKKRFDSGKLLRTLSSWASWTMLSGNVIGGAVNTGTGLWQCFKEASVGEYFNKNDLRKALGIYFRYGLGTNFYKGNFGTNSYYSSGMYAVDRNNKMYRFIEFLDATTKNEEIFSKFNTTKGATGLARINYTMWAYENGDHMMHSLVYLAAAIHTKVYKKVQKKDSNGRAQFDLLGEPEYEIVDTGKNLWDVFNHTVFNQGDISYGSSYGDPFSYKTTFIDASGKESEVTAHYVIRSQQAEYEASYEGSVLGAKIQPVIDTLKEKALRADANAKAVQYSDPVSADAFLQEKAKYELQIAKYESMQRGEIIQFNNLDYQELTPTGYAINDFRSKCRTINLNLHGIYNKIDAVAANQVPIWSAIFSMKRYWFAYFNSNWQKSRDSISLKRDYEGSARATLHVLRYFLGGKNKSIGDRVKAWSLLTGMTAMTLSPIFTMGIIGPVVAPFLSTLIAGAQLLAVKGLQRNKAIGKKARAHVSSSQYFGYKRFMSQLQLSLVFKMIGLTIGESLRIIKLDDDKDKDKEGTLAEYNPNKEVFTIKEEVDPETGEVYSIIELNAPDDKKDKSAEESNEPVYNYKVDQYLMDALLPKSLFDGDLYAKQDAFSTNTNKKIPGWLMACLCTQLDENGTYKLDKGKRSDTFGTLWTLRAANYLIHRWTLESVLLNPLAGVAIAAPTQGIEEYSLQGRELAGTVAPICTSMISQLIDYSNKDKTYVDKYGNEPWFDWANPPTEGHTEKTANLPYIQRLLVNYGTEKARLCGDSGFKNWAFRMGMIIPGSALYGIYREDEFQKLSLSQQAAIISAGLLLTDKNFRYWTDPQAAQQSFDFMRGGQRR